MNKILLTVVVTCFGGGSVFASLPGTFTGLMSLGNPSPSTLPRIIIQTEGDREVLSKTEKVPAMISITNCPEYEIISAEGMISGRGNATWTYPKKPYKIKFSSKQSPFGFPANKDWVLLAEACDRSLLRTAYMSEVSKALGMAFSIHYQHVDLYLNNEYLGIYILTDKVEKGKSRVPIESDGFIIECDYYYKDEPLYFETEEFGLGYSFKYPDADDGDIIEGDDNYEYIVTLMNNFEKSLLKLNEDVLNVEYQNYIKLSSFAKWFLAAEITGNIDCNIFYAIRAKSDMLEMMPMWDAEWSLGLIPKASWPYKAVKLITRELWKTKKNAYFRILTKASDFIIEVRKEWENFKTHIPELEKAIIEVRDEIKYSQKQNFEKWPNLDHQPPNVIFDTWEEEANYVTDFFNKRISWIDRYIYSTSFGIIYDADVVKIVNMIMDKPSDSIDMNSADTNHDGKVNVADIVTIINKKKE